MQVLMLDTSREREILRLACASVPAYFTGSWFLCRCGIEKWLHILRRIERASYERCFEYTNWEKRSQLITLNVRFFTIKVIQICTVESPFMMRTHNLGQSKRLRVRVRVWAKGLPIEVKYSYSEATIFFTQLAVPDQSPWCAQADSTYVVWFLLYVLRPNSAGNMLFLMSHQTSSQNS